MFPGLGDEHCELVEDPETEKDGDRDDVHGIDGFGDAPPPGLGRRRWTKLWPWGGGP